MKIFQRKKMKMRGKAVWSKVGRRQREEEKKGRRD